jgi:glycosyltransferase involved in cell wall biosynthesis
MKLLFVTWDAPEVNYYESLFLPALARLPHHGIEIAVLQFRWGSERARDKAERLSQEARLDYSSTTVWRRPSNALGTLASIVRGRWAIRSAVHRFDPDVIMVRGMFPGVSMLLAGGRSLRPFIFDSDGLELDSRVEGGDLSPTGAMYRVLRDVEAQLCRTAVAVLGRTQFNNEVLQARAGPTVRSSLFHVMTCGRDPGVFRPLDPEAREQARAELGFGPDDPVLIYVGSVWPQYRTPDVARFTRAMRERRPNTRLMVLTGHPAEARQILVDADQEIGAQAVIMRAAPEDVPRLIALADAGFSLFKIGYGSRAQAPIKHGEYLMCGVPIIGTPQVGETAAAVEAGLFFDESLGPEAAASWMTDQVLPRRAAVAAEARRVGVESFSLDRTVDQYLQAFAGLPRPARESRIGS